jgi:hypothetical protein
MLRKRKAGRVAAESYVDPAFLEARAMKEATRDLESYEYVFYTSKAKSHRKGTNQYEFEYPGSWRTKTGKECIFGIRSLYVKKAVRTLHFFVTGRSENHSFGKSVAFCYSCTSETTISDIVNFMNARWSTTVFKADGEHNYTDDCYWSYVAQDNVIRLVSAEMNWDIKLNFSPTVYGDNDTDVFEIVEEQVIDANQDPCTRPAIHMTWNREPLLVTADFVHQADNQHLGYTGCEFYPIKKYEIAKNTPYFTIRLWEDGTMNPVELPEDNKDIVVIEAIIERLTP